MLRKRLWSDLLITPIALEKITFETQAWSVTASSHITAIVLPSQHLGSTKMAPNNWCQKHDAKLLAEARYMIGLCQLSHWLSMASTLLMPMSLWLHVITEAICYFLHTRIITVQKQHNFIKKHPSIVLVVYSNCYELVQLGTIGTDFPLPMLLQNGAQCFT